MAGLLRVGADGFEGGDDLFKVRLHLAEVRGEAGLAVRLGSGYQAQVGGGLTAVDVEELRGGLEVRAGQAGVRVRAVLLRRSADLPRAFRTADLWLIHAADCRSRYSSRTCRGVRY